MNFEDIRKVQAELAKYSTNGTVMVPQWFIDLADEYDLTPARLLELGTDLLSKLEEQN